VVKLDTSVPVAAGALPGLGHTLSLIRDPLGFVSGLAAQGDMVVIRLGSQRMVMVCDPQMTYKLLVEDRTFDKGGPLFDRVREVSGDNVVTCPHGQHRRLRKLCQPSFSSERLAGYGATMSAVADATAAGWRDGQVLSVVREMTALVARATVQAIFATSLTPGEFDRFLDDLSTMLDGLMYRVFMPGFASRIPGTAGYRYEKAVAKLLETVAEIIARRRTDPADHGDLLYSLLSARDDDGADGSPALSEAELANQVLAFLIAGTETTAKTLAWVLYLLAAHPDIEAAVHREVDRVLAGAPPAYEHLDALEETRQVISETLRLYPPTWLITRTVTQDTVLGGTSLAAGTILAYSPYLIQHRGDLYPDPGRFDPGRWQASQPDRSAFIPFGAGARKCIGDRFSQTQATLALAAITTRWRLTTVGNRPVRPAVQNASVSPRHLHLRLTARTSA
jgi:cytochrome P450